MARPSSTQDLSAAGSPGRTSCTQMKDKDMNAILMILCFYVAGYLLMFYASSKKIDDSWPNLELLKKIMSTFEVFIQVELFTQGDCEHFYPVQFWKQICHCVEPNNKEIQRRWKLGGATWGTVEIVPKHLGLELAKSNISWSWNWWSSWMKIRVS